MLYIVEKMMKSSFMSTILEKVDWIDYQQKHEINPETWYVKEKFRKLMECYISLER